jgi:hypothetical protein
VAAVHDINLAWDLADALRDILEPGERIGAYVALDGGDTYTAIRQLTSAAVRARIPLPADMTTALFDWWSAQDGGDSELGTVVASLRTRSDRVSAPPAPQRMYLAINRGFRRVGPRPSRPPLAASRRAGQMRWISLSKAPKQARDPVTAAVNGHSCPGRSHRFAMASSAGGEAGSADGRPLGIGAAPARHQTVGRHGGARYHH